MIFNLKGKPKTLKESLRLYDGRMIDIGKSFSYLGIHLISTTIRHQTLEFAVYKATTASSITLGIVNKAKSSSLEGIRFRKDLEKVATNFYKKLLHLPRCTANWAIRTELNIIPLEYKLMEYTWDWTIKILSAKDSYLPKVCLERLSDLINSPNCKTELNWTYTSNNFLKKWELRIFDTTQTWRCGNCKRVKFLKSLKFR